MTIKVSHLIGVAVLVAALLGAAFSFGMKWQGPPEATAAAAGASAEEETATTSDEISDDILERETYEVVKIVDGDTIAISIGGKSETVRLIGIDTPETVDTRVEVQCFGKEASSKLKSLLSGRKVYFEIDEGEGERDKYKRLLAYVYRDDGLFVNKYMIEEGYAYEYTYDTKYEHQAEFKSAEKAAKSAEKGLWKPNACPPAQAALKPAVQSASTVAAPKPAALSSPAPTSTPQPQETKQAEEKPDAKPEENEEEAKPASNGTYTCSSNKYNCTDFKTHAEAQAVFDQCGGADNDIHKLDNNKDGEACESLP